MNPFDILTTRLQNQHLLNNTFQNPEDVVNHFGAIQAQDFAAAKWTIGLRMENPSDELVETAFNDGKFLRTHIMRPTWHFVMPENITWMQKLTSANVKRVMGHYNRKLELTDEVFKETNGLIIKALRGRNYLTRQDIKKLLQGVGIETDVQRLAHIVMWAELDSLICSGPKIGKQLTYALIDERIVQSRNLNRDESLAELALMYFQSHGPAQIKDFAWWSGLTMKDAQNGVDFIKSKLVKETIEEKVYYFFATLLTTNNLQPTAHLMSIYDEYTIAYKDRSALGGERFVEKLLSMGNFLTSVIILDGKITGTWKRKIKRVIAEISLNLFQKLDKKEKEALALAIENYGKFLNLKVKFSIE